MTSSPLHIRLLNLLSAIRELSPFDAMTAEEEELLRDLLVRWHNARDIPVSLIMNSMTEVSAATAYRRLMSLHAKGLIELRVDQSDRRVKFVDPTALALDYGARIQTVINGLLDESRSK